MYTIILYYSTPSSLNLHCSQTSTSRVFEFIVVFCCSPFSSSDEGTLENNCTTRFKSRWLERERNHPPNAWAEKRGRVWVLLATPKSPPARESCFAITCNSSSSSKSVFCRAECRKNRKLKPIFGPRVRECVRVVENLAGDRVRGISRPPIGVVIRTKTWFFELSLLLFLFANRAGRGERDACEWERCVLVKWSLWMEWVEEGRARAGDPL